MWLAVFAVMTSLVAAFYYLRIVKLMYFDEPVDFSPLVPRMDMGILLSANGLVILLLGLLPDQMLKLCLYAIKQL